MNWLARLKKKQMPPDMDATNATKPSFVGFVASIPAPIQKTRGDLRAVNDLASAERDALGNLTKPVIETEGNDPASEPPADPNAWRELAQAYHAHHFKCSTCIAAGRGAVYGLRCDVGAALWRSYSE